jgi:hypothetical protein
LESLSRGLLSKFAKGHSSCHIVENLRVGRGGNYCRISGLDLAPSKDGTEIWHRAHSLRLGWKAQATSRNGDHAEGRARAGPEIGIGCMWFIMEHSQETL